MAKLLGAWPLYFLLLHLLCLMKPRDTHEMIQFALHLPNPIGVHNEAKIVFD